MGAGGGVVVLGVAGEVEGDAGIDEEGDAGGNGDGSGEEGVVAGGVHGELDRLVGALAGIERGLEPGLVELGADGLNGGGDIFTDVVEGSRQGLASGWKGWFYHCTGVTGCDSRRLSEERGTEGSRQGEELRG